MEKIFGASFWFFVAGMFIAAIILGIRTIERDKKENNPYAAIGFAFQIPALGCCIIIALLCILVGIAILST